MQFDQARTGNGVTSPPNIAALPIATGASNGSMRPVLPVMAVVFLFFLTIGMALPVLPLHVHDVLGFGPVVVGLVAGGQFMASLISRLWAGRLADTQGPKRAVQLGLLASLAGGGCYLLSLTVIDRPVLSVSALLVGRTLLGGAESLIITGGITWGLGLVPASRAGQVISWVGMAMFAAMAAGAPVGSLVFSTSGLFGIAVVAVVIPILAIGVIRRLRPLQPKARVHTTVRSVLGAVMVPGICFALSGVTFASMTSFLTLHFATQGWTHGAWAFTGFASALIGVRVLFGHLPDKHGGAKVAMVCLIVQVAGLLMVALASNAWLAIAGATLAGAGFSLVFPSLGLEAVARAPSDSRGMAMGAYNAVFDLTLGVGGPALGLLGARAGIGAVFTASAAAAAMAMPIAWRLAVSRTQWSDGVPS